MNTMKMTEDMLNKVDQNNMKARAILMTLVDAHQNDGNEDLTIVIEAALDYLNRNHDLFNEMQ